MPELSPLEGLSIEKFLPSFLISTQSAENHVPINRFSFGDVASGLGLMGAFGLASGIADLGVTGLTRGVFGFGKGFASLASSLTQEGGSALALSSLSGSDFKSSFFENIAQNGFMSIGSIFLSGFAGPIFPFIQSALMVTTSKAATKTRVAVLGGPSELSQNNSEISSRYLEALVTTLLLGGAGLLIARLGKTRSYLSQLPKALGLHPTRHPNWERDFAPRLAEAQRALEGHDLETSLKLTTSVLHRLENMRVGTFALALRNNKWQGCADAVDTIRQAHQGRIFEQLKKCTQHPSFKTLDPEIQAATHYKLGSMQREWNADAGASRCAQIIRECQVNIKDPPEKLIKTRVELLGKPYNGDKKGSPIEAIHDSILTVFQTTPPRLGKAPLDLVTEIKTRLVSMKEPIPEGQDPFLTLYQVIYGTPPQKEPKVYTGQSPRRVKEILARIFTEIHPTIGNFFEKGIREKAMDLFSTKHRIAFTFYPQDGVFIPPYIIARLNLGEITPSQIIQGPAHEIGHALSLWRLGQAKSSLGYFESPSSEWAAFAMEGITSTHFPKATNDLTRLLRTSALAELENFMRQTPSPTCAQTNKKWGALLVEYGLMSRTALNSAPEAENSWAIFYHHLITSAPGPYIEGQALKAQVATLYSQMTPDEKTTYMRHIIDSAWTQNLTTFDDALAAYRVPTKPHDIINSLATIYNPVSA